LHQEYSSWNDSLQNVVLFAMNDRNCKNVFIGTWFNLFGNEAAWPEENQPAAIGSLGDIGRTPLSTFAFGSLPHEANWPRKLLVKA
jgi:hypothetical protein